MAYCHSLISEIIATGDVEGSDGASSDVKKFVDGGSETQWLDPLMSDIHYKT